MSVLKDVTCEVCGRTVELVMEGDQEEESLYCDTCKRNTRHASLCTGGCGHRARVNDWPDDPHFYRGQIKTVGVDAKGADINTGEVDESAEVLNMQTGKPMHEDPRFSDNEAREERRNRVYHRDLHRRGRTPIFFDQKG